MKYLLIFLPIFCFGQDTIVRGLDTMIIGRPYYDDRSFYKEWARIGKHKDFTGGGDSTLYGVRSNTVDTLWEIKNGWMSLKPGCVQIPLGAYYRLRENGWYKEILPDTFPNNIDIRIKVDSVFQWAETPWISCDQHVGVRDTPKRDKVDRTRAKIVVWNGCNMMELEVYKITHYNEKTIAKDMGGLSVETIKVDVVTEYLYDVDWIKSSHVIKEL